MRIGETSNNKSEYKIFFSKNETFKFNLSTANCNFL